MFPGEIAGIQYLAPENPIPIQTNFGMMQNGMNMQTLQFSTFLNNCFPNQVNHDQFTTPQSSSISNNSTTSDDAEDQQQQQLSSIIDERRQRRMISNRESARRSRMRKQKHLDELWSQVVRLRNENHNLIDKLNHATECHEQAFQENARLKEETSDLRRMLTDLQIGSPYSAFRDLEDVTCNTAHLRSESSNQSTNSSVDLLH